MPIVSTQKFDNAALSSPPIAICCRPRTLNFEVGVEVEKEESARLEPAAVATLALNTTLTLELNIARL